MRALVVGDQGSGTPRSGFVLTLLLRFVDRLLELLYGIDSRCLKPILCYIAPKRRGIQRIVNSTHVDFEGVFRRAYLV